MIRTTITLDDELAAQLDAYIARSPGGNRSEAIRDLIRRGLAVEPEAQPDQGCFGVVSCAVDQTMPGLARRLREGRQTRHDGMLFHTSIPINHQETIDIVVMKDNFARVSDYAARLFLERGIRHGTAGLIPIDEHHETHAHEDEEPHSHAHLRVRQGF
ncbi:nickel-responsive transcriptional regulator NikR [Rhodovulum strictum]|uniref:Nickel-responsive transcriptional regulator NikR n=1 Tax=Rhodovulum strictum TaxID=58314 RepID=A0A844BQQ6_9RHOB|nr:nickel-responsive transcriptional regulator NikR [Rhodovulum strictum]MRH22287.1 nickel-responsive transcriptional regulator NikR [Rhodovulum strictum]